MKESRLAIACNSLAMSYVSASSPCVATLVSDCNLLVQVHTSLLFNYTFNASIWHLAIKNK